jgi:hypothetical protein
MNYYYLVASLPALKMEETPSLDMDMFRILCRQHLSETDLATLDAVLDETERLPSQHPFATAWRNMTRQVRNAIARQRATRFQRDPSPYLRTHEGFDVWIEHAVAEAFQRPNPLERQRSLDRLLWDRAGELAAGDPFSGAAVFAYAVRLQLVERWSAMDEEAGMQVVTAKTKAGMAVS